MLELFIFIIKWLAIFACGVGCFCHTLLFLMEPVDFEELLYGAAFGAACYFVGAA